MVSGRGLPDLEREWDTVVKTVAVITTTLFINHFHDGGIVQVKKGETDLKPVNIEGFTLYTVGDTAAFAILTGKANFVMSCHCLNLQFTFYNVCNH